MTCSDHVAMDVCRLFTAMRSLECTNLVSVRKGEMTGPNGQNAFGTSIRELSILRSGLCRNCLSGTAMIETRTQKSLPADFLLSFPRTIRASYRSKYVPGTTSWTNPVADGAAAGRSVSNLPIAQFRTVVKEIGSN